ncbi:hypothetical protein chiPu_2000002 [Chiloscyllium punctatum]|uniref:Uncharacterized protein n=1 Tax=Chiloscyllium punctatum TaxID=137246 RepID=A0A401RM28_CHIPU|nr:hypothetical protein [Chiloscyllium punctatum]
MKLFLLTTLALALLVSLIPEVEAGVSFHSRPTEKGNSRSGNGRKTSSKRQVYDDVTLQMDEEQSDSAAVQMEVPSQLGLRMSEEDSRQYGEMLVQILNGLLAIDGESNGTV